MNLRAAILTACVALGLTACDPLVGVEYSDAKLRDLGAASGDVTGPSGTVSTPTTAEGALCSPKTCADLGTSCGIQNDGCGNALDCGGCNGGECQGGQCQCASSTCPDQGAMCGTTPDGCGNTLDCGLCATAGDGCNDGKCACAPQSCAAQGVACGVITDGCGEELDCGNTCSGNTPNCVAGKCSAASCVPTTCAAEGKNCGSISDGCGKLLDCGNCASGTCGGGGVANVCGCTPTTCAQLGATCGDYPDGCGSTVKCGGCLAPQSCGGGSKSKACGCTPSVTKCAAGQNCGTVPDGCGGNVACGTCQAPNNTCSGNKCSCVPDFCDAVCGYGTDNCGNSCYSGKACGGGGGGCFAAGTMVRMADGTTRAIETVRVGELVASYDPRTGESRATAVTAAKVHGVESSADGFVVIDGRLRVTPNHPLLVNGRRVFAGSVHAGDELRSSPNLRALRMQSLTTIPARVVAVSQVEKAPGAGQQTFDLELQDGSGFYADDIVVLRKLPEEQEPREPLR